MIVDTKCREMNETSDALGRQWGGNVAVITLVWTQFYSCTCWVLRYVPVSASVPPQWDGLEAKPILPSLHLHPRAQCWAASQGRKQNWSDSCWVKGPRDGWEVYLMALNQTLASGGEIPVMVKVLWALALLSHLHASSPSILAVVFHIDTITSPILQMWKLRSHL